jgi:hypothetical protein
VIRGMATAIMVLSRATQKTPNIKLAVMRISLSPVTKYLSSISLEDCVPKIRSLSESKLKGPCDSKGLCESIVLGESKLKGLAESKVLVESQVLTEVKVDSGARL